jgi:hypothetical protein
MSSKPASQRIFLALTLLAALVLASLPAQGRPVRRPTPSVTVPGDTALARIWSFVVNLWPRGTTKEGMSTAPAGDLTDEGVTIDPNGSK